MKPEQIYSTWVTVNLAVIQANIRFILEHTNTPVMAVVKANAYGHGAVPVAQAALEAGATWCGVARVSEALELRRAGLDCPILLLGYTPIARAEEVIVNRVSMTVWDVEQARKISEIAEGIGHLAHLHLKVDTGMSRLGIQTEGAFDLAQRIAQLPSVYLEGMFTHFARADEVDPAPTNAQERLFIKLLRKLEAAEICPPLVHASNSAASLTRPSAHFNLLRFGIAMYGLQPSSECPLPEDFRPALTWKAVLSQVKTLPPGHGVSYGHLYTTRETERVGTVPVGYADGLRCLPGLKVLVGGKRVPVVGRVCMDQIVVQLDAVPEAKAGDEVVLIGRQGEERLSAEDVAASWGTINYEVTCAIGPRVPRLYR